MPGKPGKPKQVISDWLDVDEPQLWLTIIAVAGWSLALYLYLTR